MHLRFSFRRILPALLAVFLTSCARQEPPPADQASVLFLLIDALRADHVGSYGYPGEITPHLDRLARSGIRFETAISPSAWTQPSIASLFTSLNPIQHGVMRWYPKEEDAFQVTVLDQGNRTLAEYLRDRGYRTAAFVANPFLQGMVGFDQGFHHYRNTGATAAGIREQFLEWLDREEPGRFFAYLHFMEPHWPYQEGIPYLREQSGAEVANRYEDLDWERFRVQITDAPDSITPEETEHLELMYAGSIREVDRVIGDLFEELERRNRFQDLLIVVTSDHGEEFGEHGKFGHINNLYDSLLKVPLLIRFPSRWREGRVIEEQVRLIDLLPSILDSVGYEGGTVGEGRSFLPLIRNPGGDPGWPPYALGEFMWGNTVFKQSVRSRDFKLIRTFMRPDVSRTTPGSVPPARIRDFLEGTDAGQIRVAYRLYDLARDPGERNNIFSTYPEKSEELSSVLQSWLQRNADRFDRTEPDMIEFRGEAMERFRGLGYLQ